jgi:putative DNA primase/helicase
MTTYSRFESFQEEGTSTQQRVNSLSAQVTIFNNAFRQGGRVTSLQSVLDEIKGGLHRQQVAQLRMVKNRYGVQAYSAAKRQLPSFTTSGTLGVDKQLEKHSGFIQLDFDHLDETLTSTKESVAADPHTAAAFISPGGDGLKVIVPIGKLDHAEGVRAAMAHYQMQHGLSSDSAVKEPTRLCFVSDDPDLHQNPSAIPVESLPSSARAEQRKKTHDGTSSAWWRQFGKDARSVNLISLFREAKMLGELLDEAMGMYSVKCPWAAEHGDAGSGWTPRSSETVLFTNERWHRFNCKHCHCEHRKVKEVCARFESMDPGSVKRHSREEHAQSTVAGIPLTSAWDGAQTDDAVLIEKFGEPFRITGLESQKGPRVEDFNPHYWSARYGLETLVLFDSPASRFYQYDEKTGVWNLVRDEDMRNALASYLLRYARETDQQVLSYKRDLRRLGEMVLILKGLLHRPDVLTGRPRGVIHLANGMLHLDCSPPELRAFSYKYFSRNQCPISFDANATCPRFLNDLVYAAINADDAKLLQRFGGMFLLGRNVFQVFLILTGLGGSGKGTIVRILLAIIGHCNVKHLRTRLLEERFELDDLDQASLLVGSDVNADFLSQRGASVIKALTGGDPLTMEAKGGAKRVIVAEHNILITCNSRLRVNLEGDASAWARRIRIIKFDRTPLNGPIAKFDEFLLRNEASGILNWLICGAVEIMSRMNQGQAFPLTTEQLESVEDLLAESDSLRLFVKKHVQKSPNSSLTVEEVQNTYENFCALRGWVALSKRQFEEGLGPLMMEFHQASKRNDVMRNDKAKRGFLNVSLPPPPRETDSALNS